MSQPLVVYHAACRDGFAAAWAAWQHFGGDVDFHPGFYGQEPPYSLAQGRDVFVLDFSYPREQMRELICRSLSTVVCEHHKTAYFELANLVEDMQFEGLRHAGDKVVFDLERSGAGLAWDHFFPGHTRPWPISYVEDRDLWRYALADSRTVNAYLGAVPFEFEAWDALAQMSVADAKRAGAAVEMKLKQYAAEVGKNAIRIKVDAYDDVPLVNAPQCDVSELLEALMDSTGSPISMAWWQRADRVFQYSLRSRGDIDVSAIAKALGGGGHKNASGFQKPEIWHQ